MESVESRKRMKQLAKDLETPEQKRARRLAKKETKEKRRREERGWGGDYVGYSNRDNPFGDDKLTEAFVWDKKLEQSGKKLSHEEVEEENRRRSEAGKAELIKVRQRRIEREKEQAEQERLKAIFTQQHENEIFKAWVRNEDSFHLQQARLRSRIRIENGRAKPIDLLAQYISQQDADNEDILRIDLQEPTTYLVGLSIEDLDDLLEDIGVYQKLERDNPKSLQFWSDLTTVAGQIRSDMLLIQQQKEENERLAEENKKLGEVVESDATGNFHSITGGTRRDQELRTGGAINKSVAKDVQHLFQGKTTNQLTQLQSQIEKKLGPDAAVVRGKVVDVPYWESVLSQLKTHMARSRLSEAHQEVLAERLYKLKQEQGLTSSEMRPVFPIKDENKGPGLLGDAPGV